LLRVTARTTITIRPEFLASRRKIRVIHIRVSHHYHYYYHYYYCYHYIIIFIRTIPTHSSYCTLPAYLYVFCNYTIRVLYDFALRPRLSTGSRYSWPSHVEMNAGDTHFNIIIMMIWRTYTRKSNMIILLLFRRASNLRAALPTAVEFTGVGRYRYE